ncbi:MAG: CS1-pili formation C-terminal domain-containing protein [Pseudohongiellaceae bacterium]
MLDAYNEPIANAVITAAGAITVSDDQGFFQVELASDVTTLDVQRGAARCEVSITPPQEISLVRPLGDSRCDALTNRQP